MIIQSSECEADYHYQESGELSALKQQR